MLVVRGVANRQLNDPIKPFVGANDPIVLMRCEVATQSVRQSINQASLKAICFVSCYHIYICNIEK